MFCAKSLQSYLFVTLWNIACQVPLSMGLSRQEYHGLLQGIFPTQGLNPPLLCLLLCQVRSLSLAPGKLI